MSNGIEAKRFAVMSAYSGKAWALKVKAMSDQQLLAVWFRLKKSGRI